MTMAVRDLDHSDNSAVPCPAAPPIVQTADAANHQLRWNSISSRSAPVALPLDLLVPHPQNPRLAPRDDVIEAIRAGLADGFDPAHALLVRPYGNGWQIASGHHRAKAAGHAGLTEVPCWVRDLDEDAAHMLLATSNAHGELSPLERGTHALNSRMDVKVYAKSVGRKRTTVHDEVSAAEMAQSVPDIRHELAQHFSQLVAIQTAPPWLWRALVSAMLKKAWTVGKTRTMVARLKDLRADAPKWVSAGFCGALVEGTVPPQDFDRTEILCAATAADLQEIERQRASASGDDPPDEGFGETALDAQMMADVVSFASYADAFDYFNAITDAPRRRLAEIRQAQSKEQRKIDEARQRSARFVEAVSLKEWQTLDDAAKAALLPPDPARVLASHFDKNVNATDRVRQIFMGPDYWLRVHCPYCSAREIATSKKGKRLSVWLRAYPSP